MSSLVNDFKEIVLIKVDQIKLLLSTFIVNDYSIFNDNNKRNSFYWKCTWDFSL